MQLAAGIGRHENALRDREVQEEVQAALQAGKIQPSQVEAALKYARSDMEGFKTFVEKSIQMVPLAQLTPLKDNADRGESRLGAQEMMVCEAMGIPPEAFKTQEHQLRSQGLI